jgi:hypothetical protein
MKELYYRLVKGPSLASTPWSLHAAARVSSRFLEQQMHWNCLKRMAM